MDMKKEREAFSEWHESAYGEYVTWGNDYPVSHIHNDRWEAWQAAKAESHKSASLYQWEINHLAAANQQLRDYAAKASAVPDGYVVVPKEPTKEMIYIGESTHYGYDNIDSELCYKAMIEAAQEQAND